MGLVGLNERVLEWGWDNFDGWKLDLTLIERWSKKLIAATWFYFHVVLFPRGSISTWFYFHVVLFPSDHSGSRR